MKTKIGGNDLYMLEHEQYGMWYFDSLYRAAEFLGVQRAQMEYAFLKHKDRDGWYISVVNGETIPYKYINCSHNELIKIIDDMNNV